MVGANDALCVDWRAVDCGHFIGVCGTEIQVLKGMEVRLTQREWLEGVYTVVDN